MRKLFAKWTGRSVGAAAVPVAPAAAEVKDERPLVALLSDGLLEEGPFGDALRHFVAQEGDHAKLLKALEALSTMPEGQTRLGIMVMNHALCSKPANATGRLFWMWMLCLGVVEGRQKNHGGDLASRRTFDAIVKSIGVDRATLKAFVGRKWQLLGSLGIEPGTGDNLVSCQETGFAFMPHARSLLGSQAKPIASKKAGFCADTPPEEWLLEYPLNAVTRESVALALRRHQWQNLGWKILIVGPHGNRREMLAKRLFHVAGLPCMVHREEKSSEVMPGVGWIIEKDGGYSPSDKLRDIVAHRVGPMIFHGSAILDEGGRASFMEQWLSAHVDLVIHMAEPGTEAFAEWVVAKAESSGVLLSMDQAMSISWLSDVNVERLLVRAQHLTEEHREEFDLDNFADFERLALKRGDVFLKMARGMVRPADGLGKLTEAIFPVATFEDLILEPETKEGIIQVAEHIRLSGATLDAWGLKGGLIKFPTRNFLFQGPSGTGKTMAAEAIAKEVGMPLRLVDTSKIHGRYYGQTEAALAEIFGKSEASDTYPILLFNEAEGFLMNRAAMSDNESVSERQWVNQMLNHLERYKGVMIFTTNHGEDFDPAALRRFALRVTFKAPDETQRLGIWERLWSPQIPVEGEVDLKALAAQFKLSGGLIMQAFVAACAKAAGRGAMTQEILVKACQQSLVNKPGNRVGFATETTSKPGPTGASRL